MTLKAPDGTLDLLAIGEALVDFVSLDKVEALSQAGSFERHIGGSPTNIAVNMTRLGGRSGIVARVGDDAFGRFLRAKLDCLGVVTAGLRTDPHARTSLVFVAQTNGTPDFLAYRDADYHLEPADIDEALVASARIIHTSTWPLSKEPARSAVDHALRLAQSEGRLISVDPNYSPRVWPRRKEALTILGEMLKYASLTKPSMDDAQRLFGRGMTPEAYIARFHELGPAVVVLTMGANGLLLSEGGRLTHVPARPVQVVDVTGAGDAFWSGFLVALLDGYPLERCAYVAREAAELKLRQIGPLPEGVNRQELYRQATG